MNDPKRLRDEIDSDLAKVLLSAGVWSPWRSARRNRVLAALGVGLAITTTRQTSFAALATWQKFALVGCIACAGAGGVAVVTQGSSVDKATLEAPAFLKAPSANRAQPNQGPASPAGQPEPTGETPSGLTPSDVVAAEAPERAAAPVLAADRRAAPSVVTKKRDVAPVEGVRQELALLERARASLHGGAAGEALATLGEYANRFPTGTLRFEAEVLRIEALAAQGRTAEASRRAQRILKRNPRSVVARRLERYVTPAK